MGRLGVREVATAPSTRTVPADLPHLATSAHQHSLQRVPCPAVLPDVARCRRAASRRHKRVAPQHVPQGAASIVQSHRVAGRPRPAGDQVDGRRRPAARAAAQDQRGGRGRGVLGEVDQGQQTADVGQDFGGKGAGPEFVAATSLLVGARLDTTTFTTTTFCTTTFCTTTLSTTTISTTTISTTPNPTTPSHPSIMLQVQSTGPHQGVGPQERVQAHPRIATGVGRRAPAKQEGVQAAQAATFLHGGCCQRLVAQGV